MQIHATIDSFRKALDAERANGSRVGFVPTMGALHAGHISLVEAAKSDCDAVAMSIFVNPLQFGKNEDLSRYPRPFEDDCAKAEVAGVDHMFAPAATEMYPNGELQTRVQVRGLSETLEGELRPGHFDGVATVVAKLFALTGHCRAYFGEKDWQQLEVVRQMTIDLSLPVQIIGCPIIREEDGLALSSRNVYMNAEQRAAALQLIAALRAGTDAIRTGITDSAAVCNVMRSILHAHPLVGPQYAAHVGVAMQSKASIESGDRLLVAAKVGTTHLIDNREVQ